MAKEVVEADTPDADIVVTRHYTALCNKICAVCETHERSRLQVFHKLGQLFDGFCKESGNKYGNATAKRLAKDIAAAGVLPELQDHLRILYWSANLYNEYPDFQQLEDLSKAGYTLTHAKQVFALPPEQREEVHSQMIVDGKVIPTRALSEIVNDMNKKRIATASAEAAADAAKAREAAEAGEEDTTPPAEAPASEDVGADPTPPDTAAGEAEVAAAAEADNPNAPATGRPTNPDRVVASPMKALRNIEKAVTRANIGIPDAFIVIRQAAQEGFDSDAAYKRYMDQIASVRASIAAFIEPAQELLRSIDSEVQAATLPDVE